MKQEDGQSRFREHVLGKTTEDKLAQAAMSVTSHDQQIGFEHAGTLLESVGTRRRFGLDLLSGNLKPVPAELFNQSANGCFVRGIRLR